jgi:hypothetical protein
MLFLARFSFCTFCRDSKQNTLDWTSIWRGVWLQGGAPSFGRSCHSAVKVYSKKIEVAKVGRATLSLLEPQRPPSFSAAFWTDMQVSTLFLDCLFPGMVLLYLRAIRRMRPKCPDRRAIFILLLWAGIIIAIPLNIVLLHFDKFILEVTILRLAKVYFYVRAFWMVHADVGEVIPYLAERIEPPFDHVRFDICCLLYSSNKFASG